MQYFKRHIIVDHFNKVVYIQVMWDQTGMVRYNEFTRIRAGVWGDYVPKQFAASMGQLIANDYKVRPMYLDGKTNPECVVLQMVDLTEEKMLEGLAPVPDQYRS